ncbi:MAG: formate dehydrogenase accessory protein FdhE [Methylocystaceae bacterium]
MMQEFVPPITLPDGYIDFYKDLETWQYQLIVRLKKGISHETIDALPLLQQRQPLLDIVNFELDIDKYRAAFADLTQHLIAQHAQTKEKAEKLHSITEKLDLPLLIDRLMSGDLTYFARVEQEIGVARDMLLFVTDHSLRPFLRLFAYPYQESLANDTGLHWDQGICPVCGARPVLARVRSEDGKRFLFCEHCFTEWPYKYLACTNCGNEEVGTIKYFTLEGDEANQIFVCDKCKGYIKTYDERRSQSKTDLYIASVATVYLDMVAQREGYGLDEEALN